MYFHPIFTYRDIRHWSGLFASTIESTGFFTRKRQWPSTTNGIIKDLSHAKQQIRSTIEFICDGKDRQQRAKIAYDVWRLARAIALGAEPAVHADPLRHRDEHEREV